MLDIAYSSSTNGYLSLDNQQLPDMRVKSCKMRPSFLDFESLNMLGTADYDIIYGSRPPDNHQLPV